MHFRCKRDIYPEFISSTPLYQKISGPIFSQLITWYIVFFRKKINYNHINQNPFVKEFRLYVN